MSNSQSANLIIHQTATTSVTRSVIRIGAQTFATADIASVSVATNAASVFGSTAYMLTGAMSIIGGVVVNPTALHGDRAGIVYALGAAALGVGLMLVSRHVQSEEKVTFTLLLQTSRGTVRALTDHDKHFVVGLADAILTAIATR